MCSKNITFSCVLRFVVFVFFKKKRCQKEADNVSIKSRENQNEVPLKKKRQSLGNFTSKVLFTKTCMEICLVT